MTRDWCKSIWLLDANIFRYARWLQSSSRHYWLNQKCIKCDVPLGPTTVDYIYGKTWPFTLSEKGHSAQPLNNNFPVSTLEFTFSPQHFLEKKILAQQQQKLGRRKFAQCPFVVIFITLKKMIDVETILEAKKKEAFFVDRKNMMWQFFLTFAAVCWSHFVSWPNWLDRCNGASFSQTFSLSSYISMMFIAALQLLIWKVTQTSHLDYP